MGCNRCEKSCHTPRQCQSKPLNGVIVQLKLKSKGIDKLKRVRIMNRLILLIIASISFTQGQDYNPEFPDAAPDGPFAVRGKGSNRISNLLSFRQLQQSQIRVFLSKIFDLLDDKCPNLNQEKMAHAKMFLDIPLSISEAPVDLPFQKLINSITRCSSNVPTQSTLTAVKTAIDSQSSKPSSTVSPAGFNLNAPSKAKEATSTSIPAFPLLPKLPSFPAIHLPNDLFGSQEEDLTSSGTEETNGLKTKLTAMKKPIATWMNNTWIKVKHFFQQVFSHKKTDGQSRFIIDEPAPILLQRRRRGINMPDFLKEVWSPTGHPAHFRPVLKMILNEIFGIYGHSCADALTHVPAFKNAARSTLRFIMQSEFIQSGAAKILDDEFVSDLTECGAMEVLHTLEETADEPKIVSTGNGAALLVPLPKATPHDSHRIVVVQQTKKDT